MRIREAFGVAVDEAVLTVTGVVDDASEAVDDSSEVDVGCFRRGDEMMLAEMPDPFATELRADSRVGTAELVLCELNVRLAARRFAVIHGCRMAGSGLSRRSGSHARHLAMKSTKSSSSVFRTA